MSIGPSYTPWRFNFEAFQFSDTHDFFSVCKWKNQGSLKGNFGFNNLKLLADYSNKLVYSETQYKGPSD